MKDTNKIVSTSRKIAKEVSTELASTGNFSISIVSLVANLLIFLIGSWGRTQAEIAAVLGLEEDEINEEAVKELARQFAEAIKAKSEERGSKEQPNMELPGNDNAEGELTMASAIFHSDKIALDEIFQDVLHNFFQITIQGYDSSNLKAALDAINRWCSDATNGTIDDIIEEIDETNSMEVVTATKLSSRWALSFDTGRTQERDFFLSDGNIVKVPMMLRKGGFFSIDQTGFKLVNLISSTGRFSTFFIMPQQDVSFLKLSDLLDDLPKINEEMLTNSAGFMDDQTTFIVPKFRTNFSGNFKRILERLGIKRLFDLQSAEILAKPANTDCAENNLIGNLAVREVKHATVLMLDEISMENSIASGTRSRSLVSSEIDNLDDNEEPQELDIPVPGPEITFNRPFLIAVVDNRNGMIVLVSAIGDPSS